MIKRLTKKELLEGFKSAVEIMGYCRGPDSWEQQVLEKEIKKVEEIKNKIKWECTLI